MKAKFNVELPLGGGQKYTNGLGRMTNMAAMPIYGKKTLKSSSPVILKLGMEQYAFKLYKGYINYSPKLTLIYFTTMSNAAKFVLFWYLY